MIRVGKAWKCKPTKSSELPKPWKIRPKKITNRTVSFYKDLGECGYYPTFRYKCVIRLKGRCYMDSSEADE